MEVETEVKVAYGSIVIAMLRFSRVSKPTVERRDWMHVLFSCSNAFITRW